MIPCGLILNELVSNALKYAFPEDVKDGKLAISLEELGPGEYCLTAQDNGIGLPEGFDISQTNTLGMQIIHMLSLQLRGSLDIKSQGGTRISVRFKA